MAKLTKAQKAAQAEAIKTLREILKPGDTVFCILRNISQSGMSRVISFLAPDHYRLDHLISEACEYRHKGNGLRVDGCGMDMGFSVVYNLSATLFPHGFGCTGSNCPANDHANGDRDRTPHGAMIEARGVGPVAYDHWHVNAGGYALRCAWL